MANNINTIEIGDEFEQKSLQIIKKVIEKEQLGILASCIRIYTKKGYYSEDRKKDIVFDLTIEIWPPEADRYVMIYIIECKDYKQRVPVSKIEDFRDKIRQVAGVNVKGIFISNSPLQESAFNIAKSSGMMLIQGESSEDYQIILHKSSRDVDKNGIPKLSETIQETLIDSNVTQLEKLIDKTILDVFVLDSNPDKISYNIDKITKEHIEKIAIKELIQINPRLNSDAYHRLSCKSLIEYLNVNYGVEVTYIKNFPNLLGLCNIKNNGIGINQSIYGTKRELFVLAHEFGHYILHQKLQIGQDRYDRFNDSEYDFMIGKHRLNNPRHWIEWQANYFAASLILPKVQILVWTYKFLEDQGRPKISFYLDDQDSNIRDFGDLINKLSTHFHISKTCIIYRLKDLNMINDQSRIKSIGQIIAEYKDQFWV